ncbi:LysR family transcriptional regulator [Pseudomonas sp. UL073]|uniref:LysR family transcriptional regulator n=1 Tax=Zestomonas insulae TaxID=2809017 RepID=A0ABS2IAH7_9GAMM|nr:LysR family transcriptional regulator [Pseudomonas insulae]MBM7060116.1 LysR family transcriptional regulator [Pseudomonas insulae]
MADLIDLKRIHHLVLLGEELHFSRAAERANLSQTAFSRSIQALEAELGVRLFDRDTRSVALTAAGRQLLARGRELLGSASRLSAEALHIAQGEGGELNFGASMMAADLYLPEALISLRQRVPRLTVKVEVNHWHHLLPLLEQERIEFIVAYTQEPLSDARLAVTALPPQPASIFCRREHPLAQQTTPIQRLQLADYPWSSVRAADTTPARLRAGLDLPAGTPVDLALTCNDLNLLRATTLASDALLFTWRAWLTADLYSGALLDLAERVTPALAPLSIGCWIVSHAGRTLSPIARQAIELIQASAERQAAPPDALS